MPCGMRKTSCLRHLTNAANLCCYHFAHTVPLLQRRVVREIVSCKSFKFGCFSSFHSCGYVRRLLAWNLVALGYHHCSEVCAARGSQSVFWMLFVLEEVLQDICRSLCYGWLRTGGEGTRNASCVLRKFEIWRQQCSYTCFATCVWPLRSWERGPAA